MVSEACGNLLVRLNSAGNSIEADGVRQLPGNHPMKTKYLGYAVCVAVFIAILGWWCAYFPYDAEKMCRAIPPNAVYFSEHANLASRWKTVAGSPFSLTILNGFGITPADVGRVLNDTLTERLVRLFGGRTTIVAYAPSYGNGGQPAWLFTSWAGANSQLVKLGLAKPLLNDFRTFDAGRGDKFWVLNAGRKDRKERLSLAFADGILMGCYSADPAGVVYMLRRVEEKAPLAPDLKAYADDLRNAVKKERYTDRGWYRWASVKDGKVTSNNLSFLRNVSTNGISEGWLRGSPCLLPVGRPLNQTDVLSIKSIVGDAPDLLAVMPQGYLLKALEEMKEAAGWLPALKSFVDETGREDGAAFVGVLSETYSGRILGIKAPTLVAGMQVGAESNVLARASLLMDQINAATRWGLMLTSRSSDEDMSPAVIGSAKEGVLSDLEPRERPAFAVTNGWLVVCSNVENLETLFGGSVLGQGAGVTPRWLMFFSGDTDSAYAHLDLKSASQTLRNALAVYSILLTARDGEKTKEKGRMLSEIRGWIEAGKSCRSCLLRFDSNSSEYQLRFRVESGDGG